METGLRLSDSVAPAGAAAARAGRWRDAERVLDQARMFKRMHPILYVRRADLRLTNRGDAAAGT